MKKLKTHWILPTLISAMTLLIWAQSLLPGEVSAEESGFFARLLAGLLGLEVMPDWWHALVRKVAHFSEFGVLGALWSGYGRRRPLRCSWVYGIAVAAVDECLQFIQPDRGPAVTDVMIDYAGYACGWLAVFFIATWIRKKEI